MKTLVAIGCPEIVSPHQIQGVDIEKMFPVVQWLVKQVRRTRRWQLECCVLLLLNPADTPTCAVLVACQMINHRSETAEFTRGLGALRFEQSYKAPDAVSDDTMGFVAGVSAMGGWWRRHHASAPTVLGG